MVVRHQGMLIDEHVCKGAAVQHGDVDVIGIAQSQVFASGSGDQWSQLAQHGGGDGLSLLRRQQLHIGLVVSGQ